MMEMMVEYLNECFKFDSLLEVWRYDDCGIAYLHPDRVDCFFKINRDFYMLYGSVSTSPRYSVKIYNIDELKNAVCNFFEDLKKLKVEKRKKMIEEI